MTALYVGDTPPRIDGRLDDEVWARAQAIDDLVQNEPDNMAAPTERTVVKVAYDDRSIYVGVFNYMRVASQVTTALGRRDTNPRSDMILDQRRLQLRPGRGAVDYQPGRHG